MLGEAVDVVVRRRGEELIRTHQYDTTAPVSTRLAHPGGRSGHIDAAQWDQTES